LWKSHHGHPRNVILPLEESQSRPASGQQDVVTSTHWVLCTGAKAGLRVKEVSLIFRFRITRHCFTTATKECRERLGDQCPLFFIKLYSTTGFYLLAAWNQYCDGRSIYIGSGCHIGLTESPQRTKRRHKPFKAHEKYSRLKVTR